jgi:Putative zincin peptidase
MPSVHLPRLIIGAPLNNQIAQGPSWKRLDGWGASASHMTKALGFGLLMGFCVAVTWRLLDTNTLPIGVPTAFEFIVVLLVLTVVHEALHLLGFPGFGFDGHSACGVWPKGGSPFAQYLRPVSRNRFIFFTATPFVVLSLMPLVVKALGYPVSHLIAWTSVINSVGAGSDLLACALLLKDVPKNAEVIESDMGLYWKAD